MNDAFTADQMRAVLDCPMDDRDSGATSIRDYFAHLAALCWAEGECFDGKRPFGNSGWDRDVYVALHAAGLMDFALDEDGYIDSISPQEERRVGALVFAAIRSMGSQP